MELWSLTATVRIVQMVTDRYVTELHENNQLLNITNGTDRQTDYRWHISMYVT